MTTPTYWRRIVNANPIHPYHWEARYRDGGRLKQFDHDGPHFSKEIDRARLVELVVHGAPGGEIQLPVLLAEGAVPDEVIVKAVNDIKETIELGTGQKVIARSVRYYLGFRYGANKFLLEIDEHGRLSKTNDDEGVLPIEVVPNLLFLGGGPR